MKIYPIEGRRVDGTVTFIFIRDVAIDFGYRYYCPPPKDYILRRIFETIEFRLHSQAYMSTGILMDTLKRKSIKYGLHRGKPLNISKWFN